MLMEWLEPSIEKGIDKAFDSFVDSKEYLELNGKIMAILCEQDKESNVDSKYLELEGLFLLMAALLVKHSYRYGFKDMMNIYLLPRQLI
ncbi:MAG: hypothetical protein WD469_08010 [Paenibacillaceae bacterium]